jgi:hypothetical protein
MNLKTQARARLLRTIYDTPARSWGDGCSMLDEGPEAEAARADAARLVYSDRPGGSASPGQNTINAAVTSALQALRQEILETEDPLRAAGLLSIAAEVWRLARTQRPWRPPQAYADARTAWLEVCASAHWRGVNAGPLGAVAGRGAHLQHYYAHRVPVDDSIGLDVRIDRQPGEAKWRVKVWDVRTCCEPRDEHGNWTGPYFPRPLRLGFVSYRAFRLRAWLDYSGFVHIEATPRHWRGKPREFRSLKAVPDEFRLPHQRGAELEPPPPPPVEEEC